MRTTICAFLVLALSQTQNPTRLAVPGLPPGPHGVGFRHELLHDASRPYRLAEDRVPEPGGRPISLSIWYPADRRGSPLRLQDYVEINSGDALDAGARRAAFSERLGPPAAAGAATALLGRTLLASRDVPAAGRSPLILFAHASPAAQSVMAEFLASYGFVVAGLTSRDAAVGSYKLSVANLDAMGRDLQFAAAWLAGQAFVDASRPAVIGMSNGALGGVAFESIHGRLAALVSLDGTIGERVAAQAIPKLAGAQRDRLTAPLLHLYTPDNSYLDFTELRSHPRQVCALAEVRAVGHTDFLADAVFRSAVQPDDPERRLAAAKFAWISRRTLEFVLQHMTQAALPSQLAREDGAGPPDVSRRPC